MFVEAVYYKWSNNEVTFLQVKVKNRSILHPPSNCWKMQLLFKHLNIESCEIYTHCNKLAFDFCRYVMSYVRLWAILEDR